MFIRRLIVPAFALIIGFIALIGGLRELAGTDGLRSVLAAPGCDGLPCFIGVQLYETNLTEGRARLDAHPHIQAVAARPRMDFVGDEHVRFEWTARPGTPDGWRAGEVVANYGTIYEVWLEASSPLGEVWRALGQPPVYSYTALLERTGDVRVYVTLFDDARARLTVRMACPLTLAHFLAADVQVIELRRVQLGFRPGPDLRSLTDWYRHVAQFPMC